MSDWQTDQKYYKEAFSPKTSNHGCSLTLKAKLTSFDTFSMLKMITIEDAILLKATELANVPF